ncbi:Imm52 family immunity protein [Salinicola acroporae]|uniref:Immunity protein 52 domain-containing protein n=1 Tax=Salinicola acroporae TaxID=1541440 RepID=A0ABT6I1G0_9GAMM|nr:Imm52 family immunity protein [Salinicola acroporae]MDH4571509.1 hypothetical protein [Salinicola acroporae]
MKYSLRMIFPKNKEDLEIEEVYLLFLKATEKISEVDTALSDWQYPLITEKDKAIYCPVTDKSKVLKSAYHETHKNNESYKGKGLVNFTAWSMPVPTQGLKESEKPFFAKARLLDGSADLGGSFVLNANSLKDTKSKDYWSTYSTLFKKMARIKKASWSNFSTKGYHRKAAFPHREWVGWMALVPDVDLSNEMPFVALAEYLPDIGTLIVTTKEPFDPENEEHIKLARATEVFLADRGLLPERGI